MKRGYVANHTIKRIRENRGYMRKTQSCIKGTRGWQTFGRIEMEEKKDREGTGVNKRGNGRGRESD